MRGTAPDGRSHRADDPALLTWVHTVEVRSFPAGYQTYGPGALRLTPAECDAYCRPPVAQALGAQDVPETSCEVERYLADRRPQLRATPAALDSVLFLRRFGRTLREWLVVGRLTNASLGLLLAWRASNSVFGARLLSVPAGTGPWRRPSDAPLSGGSGHRESRLLHGGGWRRGNGDFTRETWGGGNTTTLPTCSRALPPLRLGRAATAREARALVGVKGHYSNPTAESA
ncbi:oxygenase MpaB family protein [Streptomyces parvulus]|uniref:oxygenase MpaB family protein n=1 Tax=Streptomyces parvulus TaxID=146923 RepID=UPI00215DB05C|nr:oxygenase MpaB family protein [Streptomyces parvulus]